MAILYSPYIEGSIPAFTSESGLQVPFANNPGVGFNEWNVMTAKITSMSPNSEVSYNLSKIAYVSKYFNNSEKITASKATFIDPVLDNLIPGEFYKVQLAYGENFNEDKTLLNYSTVGVARYLGATNPTIELDPSSDTICKSYTGTYVSPNGITEQEYSY